MTWCSGEELNYCWCKIFILFLIGHLLAWWDLKIFIPGAAVGGAITCPCFLYRSRERCWHLRSCNWRMVVWTFLNIGQGVITEDLSSALLMLLRGVEGVLRSIHDWFNRKRICSLQYWGPLKMPALWLQFGPWLQNNWEFSSHLVTTPQCFIFSPTCKETVRLVSILHIHKGWKSIIIVFQWIHDGCKLNKVRNRTCSKGGWQ